MDRENIFLVLFAVAFLFSVSIIAITHLGLDASTITGLATSGTTTSNVTISKSFSITLSTNLSSGIRFGNVSTAVNLNASSNYDGSSSNNQSTYLVNTSTDATVNIDFCIKANKNLTDSSSGDTINLNNETYANATTTSGTVPALANEVAFTTSGIKSGQNLAPGGTNYYRFWLDVAENIPSGTYNNTITFTGVEVGDSCT